MRLIKTPRWSSLSLLDSPPIPRSGLATKAGAGGGSLVWRGVGARSANDKIQMRLRTPHPHTICMAHMRNLIPFPHRDLAAAYLTSLSLLNRQNVALYNL